MRSSRSIRVVASNAEVEVGDAITEGVVPPLGDTLWEQQYFIARDGRLRNLVPANPEAVSSGT